MTTKEFAKILQDKLTSEYGVDLSVASHQQIYRALALICRQMMSENHKKFQSKAIGTGSKQVYYLCMEFLMGRSLKMSLFNLGLNEAAQKALAEADISLDSIYEEEPDAGLGNGGLGRLAACYLDGMATTSICGTGYSILYEYGIFKQKIVDGWQQERADNWLPGGQVWLKSHPDQAVEVRFDGEIHENWDHGFHYIQHTNYNSVMAIPSDMYVQGYDGKGVAKLRLWQAKAPDFDMSSFSLGNYNTAMSKNASAELISKVLYPNDNHVEGKILRLRQQYFLSAASIGDIVQNHLSTYGTLENLPDKVAIQLNDTHPTLAIPEMMRILLDECGFGWDKSLRHLPEGLLLHQPHRHGRGSGEVERGHLQDDPAPHLPDRGRDGPPRPREAGSSLPRRPGQDQLYGPHRRQSGAHGQHLRLHRQQHQRRLQAPQRDHQAERLPRLLPVSSRRLSRT